MILSLDTGTKTGWCLWDNGKVVESGTEDFSKKRGESNGSMFLRFRHWLHNILMSNNVRFVIYEQAHHRGGAATEICVNLTGRVQEECAKGFIEHATIHTATLKKFATGDGRADKARMCEAAAIIVNHMISNDDEADAILMAKYASETY